MLPVRDEADIIGQCLRHLLTWADAVYIFDTGSVDETWEIVQEFAAGDDRVVPLRKDAVYFNDASVRGWMFHQARQKMRAGDWFLRVDADEFYHIPPPEFVKTRLSRHETIVYHQYYNFVLRATEVRAWEAGKETLADRDRPIEERRQWYQVSTYAEPRLCRYRDTMRWPPTVSFPFNSGFVAVERLPVRHYPHRDPVQLERRCRLRAFLIGSRGDQLFTGYELGDVERFRRDLVSGVLWERDRKPEAGQERLQAEWERFVVSDDTAELKHWPPGSELPEVHQQNHLSRPYVRLAQRLTHALMLPVLDRLRPRWPDDAYPQHIPAGIVTLLEQGLKM